MSDVVSKYLHSQYFGNENCEPSYEIPTWIESQLVGGFQTVTIPLSKSANALFIEIMAMSISTDGLGGVVSFKDSRLPTNLFSINNNVSFFTVTRFSYVVNNTSFVMQSTSATVLFALEFSRVSKRDKILKK